MKRQLAGWQDDVADVRGLAVSACRSSSDSPRRPRTCGRCRRTPTTQRASSTASAIRWAASRGTATCTRCPTNTSPTSCRCASPRSRSSSTAATSPACRVRDVPLGPPGPRDRRHPASRRATPGPPAGHHGTAATPWRCYAPDMAKQPVDEPTPDGRRPRHRRQTAIRAAYAVPRTFFGQTVVFFRNFSWLSCRAMAEVL